MNGYRIEFPDFPEADMPAIPQGWEDASWHNEPAPHFITPNRLAVWIDYADTAQREEEMAGLPRFAIYPVDDTGAHTADEPILATDDWSAVLAAVLAKTFPEALRAPVTDLPSAKRWIEALSEAGLTFHFEDDPADCLSECGLTDEQIGIIADRRDALYALEWGPRPGLGYWYCPIGYTLRLDAMKEGGAQEEQAAGFEPGATLCFEHEVVALIYRADCPSYDYGAPGRYQTWREGAHLDSYDTPDEAFSANPNMRAAWRGRLQAAGFTGAMAEES